MTTLAGTKIRRFREERSLSRAAFGAWYDSPGYQEILPLRTRNSDGVTLLVGGVPEGYRAAAYAEKLVSGG